MTAGTIDRDAALVEGYIEVSDEVADQISKVKVARKNERGWKGFRDESTAAVKEALAGASGAIYRGRIIATLKSRNGRRQVDLDLLAAKHPSAYAECVSDGAEQTILDIP